MVSAVENKRVCCAEAFRSKLSCPPRYQTKMPELRVAPCGGGSTVLTPHCVLDRQSTLKGLGHYRKDSLGKAASSDKKPTEQHRSVR